MKRCGLFLLIFAGAGWTLVAGTPRDDGPAKSPSPSTAPGKADPSKRVPWTTSRITGSPEPPAPYRMERVFPKLEFKNPLLLVRAPGTNRLFVAEQAGPIYSFK